MRFNNHFSGAGVSFGLVALPLISAIGWFLVFRKGLAVPFSRFPDFR